MKDLWDELDEISAELEQRGVLRLAEDVRTTASLVTKSPKVVLKCDFADVKEGTTGNVISSVRDYFKIKFGNKIVTGIHKNYLDIIRGS